MKFCCDCVYYIEARGEAEFERNYSRCERSKHFDPVTGIDRYNYCLLERESMLPTACGKEAKYYQEPDRREEWQRDEPQGVTNWDTGWNGVYAEENRNG